MMQQEIEAIGQLIRDSNDDLKNQIDSMESRIEDRISQLAIDVKEIRLAQVSSDRQFIEFKAETNVIIKSLADSRDKFGERLGAAEAQIRELSVSIEKHKTIEAGEKRVKFAMAEWVKWLLTFIVSAITAFIAYMAIHVGSKP